MTENTRGKGLAHITEDDQVEAVELPDFGQSQEEPKGNLFNRHPSWYDEEDSEVVEEAEELKPLTIEDIEAIRQAAYEEGFAEGQAAGHQEGLEKGRLEGLEQGHTEGLSQGLKEGLEQGQQQIDTLSGYWRQLIDELENPVQQLTVEVQKQLVALITEVARAVLKVELTTNEQAIIATVKEAVQAMPVVQQQLKIYLHPDDLLVIEGVYPEATLEKNNWQLLSDASLARGDCQIITDHSMIDRSMEQVINEALHRFLNLNSQSVEQAEPPEKPDDVAAIYQAQETTQTQSNEEPSKSDATTREAASDGSIQEDVTDDGTDRETPTD